MRKEKIYSLSSLYRENMDIYGYRFGKGEKAACIVGAMRGNEIQQMYIGALLVKSLKELEEIYNEGEQSGVQKGIQKGELKKARETVFALLEMGMPVEQITKAVKIPLTTVQSWIAETKF